MAKLAAAIGVVVLGDAGFRAVAEQVTVSRAIYWELPDRNTDATRDIPHLLSLGISEVHIFLNEPTPEPENIASQCLLFSYTNSDLPHGLPRWTPQTLSDFTKALQAGGLKVVFTLSPHHRFEAYIKDLSNPGKPLWLARQIKGIAIELDVETNWLEEVPPKYCGPSNWKDMPARLAGEIRDTQTAEGERKPLTLIVSTNSVAHHPEFLELADVIAPQLYDEQFGHLPDKIHDELSNKWFLKGRVFQPALTVFCRATDQGKCSQDIFDKSVKVVAQLAKCNTQGKTITGVAIWSEKTIRQNSTFGESYLSDPTKRIVDVTCPRP